MLRGFGLRLLVPQDLRGKVAIANAKVAYQDYGPLVEGERWRALEAAGASAVSAFQA